MPNVERPAEAGEKTVAFAKRGTQYGFTMVPNALLEDERLTAGARLTYVMLAKFAHQKEECWPGQQRLAELVGVARKALGRYVNELVEVGLVEVTRRGMGLTNVYRLHLPDEVMGQNDPSRRVMVTHPDGTPVTHKEEEGQQEGVEGEGSSSSMTLAAPASAGAREASIDWPERAGVVGYEPTSGEENARTLCEELRSSIISRGCRPPNISREWMNSARLLVDRDGVTPDEVSAAIKWVDKHPFWSTNILSMPTLRKQFDRLRLQARAEQTNGKSFQERRYDDAMSSLERMIDGAPS